MSVTLSRLLQRSPKARYQTAGELANELRGWLAQLDFSQAQAADELNKLKTAAGGVMADMGFKGREDTATASA